MSNSLVSGGCVIEGNIEHSIISPGVRIAEGAVVKDSIIMEKTSIGRRSVIDRCILDKDITIGADSYIGSGEDLRANRLHPDVVSSGLTVIGKGAAIPSKYKIGRNCIVFEGVTGNDLPLYHLKSGETARHKKRSVRVKV
jgi:glucose-1-phosphate adenylyltransferase